MQAASRSSFLLEAAQPIRISGETGRKNLDRNFAGETAIFGSIHFSHAASTHERENLIGSKSSADLC